MPDLLVESPLCQEIRQDGIKEGEQKVLLKQLTRKFGILEETTIERLKKLSSEDAESLAEAIFDLEMREDLDKWFNERDK